MGLREANSKLVKAISLPNENISGKWLRLQALRRKSSSRQKLQEEAGGKISPCLIPNFHIDLQLLPFHFVAMMIVVGGGTGIAATLWNPADFSQVRYSRKVNTAPSS